MSNKTFAEKMKELQAILGTLPLLLPAVAFFTNYAPPLLEEVGLFTTAISAYFLYRGAQQPFFSKALLNKAVIYLLTALVLVVIYLLLLRFTSANVTIDDKDYRFQTGWSTADWSLDSAGIALKNDPKAKCNSVTPRELLLCAGVSEDNVWALWKDAHIIIFGLVNLVVFCVAFFSWAYGWGLVVRKL